MSWQITGAPRKTWCSIGGEKRMVLAFRIDTESGSTEALVGLNNEAPQWTALEHITGVWQRNRR